MSASIVLKALASASAVVLPMLRMPMAKSTLSKGRCLEASICSMALVAFLVPKTRGDPSFFSSPVDTSGKRGDIELVEVDRVLDQTRRDEILDDLGAQAVDVHRPARDPVLEARLELCGALRAVAAQEGPIAKDR